MLQFNIVIQVRAASMCISKGRKTLEICQLASISNLVLPLHWWLLKYKNVEETKIYQYTPFEIVYFVYSVAGGERLFWLRLKSKLLNECVSTLAKGGSGGGLHQAMMIFMQDEPDDIC